jgi:GT2 family glycosyltransferase
MAFRRDVLEIMGGFDEALDTGPPLSGGGDLDIFFRILRSGRELVYEPSYLVFHEHRRETAALRRQYYSWGLSFMAFLTKVYRADSLSRGRVRKLIVWWLQYQTGLLLRGLKGRKEFRPDFVLAEVAGGARGLCGEYGRSVRRIRRLRERL